MLSVLPATTVLLCWPAKYMRWRGPLLLVEVLLRAAIVLAAASGGDPPTHACLHTRSALCMHSARRQAKLGHSTPGHSTPGHAH